MFFSVHKQFGSQNEYAGFSEHVSVHHDGTSGGLAGSTSHCVHPVTHLPKLPWVVVAVVVDCSVVVACVVVLVVVVLVLQSVFVVVTVVEV
jgi:hypothetical protein